jgi:hypothetical protein
MMTSLACCNRGYIFSACVYTICNNIYSVMYQGEDQVSGLLAQAEEFCLTNDRMLYAPFLRALEEWCARHECAVGNAHFYLINKPTKDSFVIDIYAAYALTTARTLADELYRVHAPHVDVRTLGVETILKNAEFNIKVNERIIARVYGAPAYRKINMIALMGPVPRGGLFADVSLPCLPPEIHLAGMYRTLYSPTRASEWETTWANIPKFWEGITAESLVEKTRLVTGGAEHARDWRAASSPLRASSRLHGRPDTVSRTPRSPRRGQQPTRGATPVEPRGSPHNNGPTRRGSTHDTSPVARLGWPGSWRSQQPAL